MSSGTQPTPTLPGSGSSGLAWWRRNGVITVAAALVVAGSVVFLVAPTTVPLLGWTAYTPLSPGNDFSRTSYLTPQHLIGAAIAAVGLIVLAGAVGFRLGRRRTA